MSESEFYGIFENPEDCYLAAFDEVLAGVSQLVADAARSEQHWLERVRAGVHALLGFFDAEPRRARLLTIPAPFAQPAVFERRQQAISTLAVALDQRERGEKLGVESGRPRFGMTTELIVRGVLSLIEAQILTGDRGQVTQLEPALMAFIVAPYLGVVAASAELDHMSASSHNRKAPERPWAMRTTYRTSRVLQAIGATPRSSNREIADAAGLTDEGQTSKLLARLERKGLIENVGLGSAHGEPNAWLLTPYGRRVVKAIGNGFAVSPTVQGRRRVRGTT